MSLVDDIMANGVETRAQLRELLCRHKYAGDNKTLVVLAYVDIALEHHQAIWLLTKSGLSGSAFAIIRLLFDVMLRAYWINGIATEQQIEKATRDDLKFPPMPQMREDIKEHYGPDKSDLEEPEDLEDLEQWHQFFRTINEVWQYLNSFTHSGGLQLERRFTGNDLEPNYSDRDIAHALNLSSAALLILVHMFFHFMGYDKEAHEVMTLMTQSSEFVKQYNIKYNVPHNFSRS
jgi:uncharacterized protein DUF6988